mgnify:CR=1 FL=1
MCYRLKAPELSTVGPKRCDMKAPWYCTIYMCSTWVHSPLLQLELPQSWDTINLTAIVR